MHSDIHWHQLVIIFIFSQHTPKGSLFLHNGMVYPSYCLQNVTCILSISLCLCKDWEQILLFFYLEEDCLMIYQKSLQNIYLLKFLLQTETCSPQLIADYDWRQIKHAKVISLVNVNILFRIILLNKIVSDYL